MQLCINPRCPQPEEPLNTGRLHCRHCGSPLLLKGKFRAIALLQEDDFSKLYDVQDDRGCRQVLRVLTLENPRAISLLQQHAKILARANHPGLPKVEPDGYWQFSPPDSSTIVHALAMEKIDGVTLDRWFQARDDRQISESLAIDWLGQLVEILDLLHQQLYFHCDIRPQNIVLRENGTLTLVNFGNLREVAIAYLVAQARSLVPHSRAIETLHAISPGYTPREQAQGRGVPQSDFFSLGRTWVYLLTGKPPTDFPEDPRTGRLIWQHRAPQLSPGLVDLLDWMMSPLPSDRPHTTAAIRQHLQRLAPQPSSFQLAPTLKARSPESSDGLSNRSNWYFPHVKAKPSKITSLLLWGGSAILLGAIATHSDWSPIVNKIVPKVELESERQSQ